MEDISMMGMFFTWIQKKKNPELGILKKLDRIMGNNHFLEEFKASFANFLPFLISDHSPALLTISNIHSKKPRTFRFMNFLADKACFLEIVKERWFVPVDGFAMFVLARILRLLKKHMRKLNRDNGNVFDNVKLLKVELQRVQMDLVKNPNSSVLREEDIV